MVYPVLKFLMRTTLWVYYRHVFINGLQYIPKSGPFVLACNHPNSFLDAIIIACFCPRELYFLARGDVFNAPWKHWILSRMNMTPIFRSEDGYGNLEKNQKAFSASRKILDAGKGILIFSEGLCIQEMKLRRLRKGTARIALDFISTGKSLPIVPIGINYPHPMQYRKEVLIGISKPFDALQFQEAFRNHKGNAINQFNDVLRESLQKQVIQLKDSNEEHQFRKQFELLRKNFPKRYLNLDTDIPEKAMALSKTIDTNPIPSDPLSQRRNPLFYPGYVLNILPIIISQTITRSRVRYGEFYDSVLLSVGMFMHLFYLLAIFLVFSTISLKTAFFVVIGTVASGIIAVRNS